MNGDKHLGFYDTDENKKLLKKYNDVLNGIMSEIRKIDDDCLNI